MHNNLLRPEKKLVSALMREENIATHGWVGGIFSFLSMCFSLNKAVLQFNGFVRDQSARVN